jgi:hypothetical protein
MTLPMDESLRRQLLAAFRMPSVQTTVSRKSSITNAFVIAVIPVIQPTPEEIGQALALLGMVPSDVRCAFCGDKSSEWDHLRPLVQNRRPTGYISEIHNLVPACGKCNQSKGNKPWRAWMMSEAPQSPTGRKLPNIPDRIARLDAYENWRPPTKVDFETILGREDWDSYWALWESINTSLVQCKEVADLLLKRVNEHLEKTRSE